MQGIWSEPIMTKESSLTTLQLKQLLIGLKEHGNNTCIRVRSMGAMWQTYFMRVVTITEDRVLLNDEASSKLISFPINQIIQVEIDHKFMEFQPHNHYTIKQDAGIVQQFNTMQK